jgi:hypothetical protein
VNDSNYQFSVRFYIVQDSVLFRIIFRLMFIQDSVLFRIIFRLMFIQDSVLFRIIFTQVSRICVNTFFFLLILAFRQVSEQIKAKTVCRKSLLIKSV